MKSIEETSKLTAKEFHNEVLPLGKPLVIRGLVADWPIVKAGKSGARAFCDYVRRFDQNLEVNTVFGPPQINGRIFYNHDLTGLNCSLGQSKLSTCLDYLLEHVGDIPQPTLALQSIVVHHFLSGMENENFLDLLPNIKPRIWIGGKAIVAAHYDPSENIACCLAGRRQFTLFSPEQISNLYVGPLENTPAGAAISMVDFDNPDYDRYPRFKEAECHALQATLEPGDVIYIPYLWWHHVRSLEKVNALMNYWWGEAEELRGDPRNALFHAMLSIRDLPDNHRNAWKQVFNHYIFESNGKPAEHLPVDKRGILGDLKPDFIRIIRTALATTLNRIK